MVNYYFYDVQLIAVYGYYKIQSVQTNINDLKKGIEIIELSSPYFFNENLQLVLARSYVKINDKDKAKEILEALIDKDLLTSQANEMLETLK